MTGLQRVRDVMTARPACVRPDVPVMDCAERLVSSDLSGLLVVDADRKLLGIITERDLIDVALSTGYHDESGGRVGDYMTNDPATVQASDSLMDVAERFSHSSYRRFPVLDGDRLVGLISRRNVLRALTEGSWFSQPK